MRSAALLAGVIAVMALAACGTSRADSAASTPPQTQNVQDAAVKQAPPPPPPPTPQSSLQKPAFFQIAAGEQTQGGWVKGQAPHGTVALRLDERPVTLASDGYFFAAFDRDAGKQAVLVATLADGREISHPVAVSARGWNIEHVNVARRPGGPSAAFMAIRRPELERIGAARALLPESDGWRQGFIWPVKGRISGRFGSQRVYRGEPASYHTGLDIAPGGSGAPFVAPADGVVVLAAHEPFTLEGRLLIIEHGMGLTSAFLHCQELMVQEGDKVVQGQPIGRIGATGRATGPHLHWGLMWQGARLDPLLFVGPMN